MPKKHRLFLLDGMALIYRAHFALIKSPIFTSKGFNASAIYGFANTLLDIVTKQQPTHLALALDTAAPTPRHDIFPQYKAQRQEIPEELSASIPHIKRLARAFNVPIIELDGYEADDTIGTLARRADATGEFETFMVTPDKDFAQLVTETTHIYKPGRQGSDAEILELPDVLAKWEVERPEQIIDILGLWGDTSDNIPGIPSIGEKTAKKLIKEYGSIEGLLAHTDELKGKQKENVEAFGEQGLLSKKLVTILVDAPVPVALEDLVVREHDEDALRRFFVEFEFNALGKRLFGESFKAGRGAAATMTEDGVQADLKTFDDVKTDYQLADTDEKRARLIADLTRQKSFCLDLETSTLDPRSGQILGLAFSWKAGSAHYVPLPLDDETAALAILRGFESIFADPAKTIIGHNLKFDVSALIWRGIAVRGPYADSMLAHALLEPDQRHNMDYLSEALLGYTPIAISSLIGERKGKAPQKSLIDACRERLDDVSCYACEDADVTWQISAKLLPQLTEKRLEKVFYEVECPLLQVLAEMEKEGVTIDSEALAEVGQELGLRADRLKAEVFELAGEVFNLDSPKQLGEVLFERLRLVEKPKKTSTGQYSTKEDILSSLASQHPIVQRILDYRQATKLKNTYVDNLPHFIHPQTGRVHSHFQQMLTDTGRLQSHDPNLQNIPIRSELGREVRKVFIPGGPGRVLLSADYSQIELRVMASMSGDEAMCAAFQTGADIHTATAAAVYGVPAKAVQAEMRRTAKMVNFGIIYGISGFGLGQRLGIPTREAKAMIDEYFKLYPGVRRFMDALIEKARDNGYVETLIGRRRYLRNINSGNWTVRSQAERRAINTPIQGTAADMIKLAMIRVSEAFAKEKLRSKMILQVHDELLFDVYEDERLLVQPLVEQCMREALPLKVPVIVETGFGGNWLDAH